MRKIFILCFGLIVLIAGFTYIMAGRNRPVNKTNKSRYKIMHGYAGDVLAGTTSSANYKLTAGTVAYLAPENEEAR